MWNVFKPKFQLEKIDRWKIICYWLHWTNNLDTVSNLIHFYIKEEYLDPEFHKINLNHPDSIYTLFSANLEKPELTVHFKIQFYKDGTIKFTPVSFTVGCNLMDYGFGNLIYVSYYNLVTSKNLLDCKK